MNRCFRHFILAAVAAGLLPLAGVSAHEFKAGALAIDHPASRPTSPRATTGVGYLAIINSGSTADTLLGGSSEAAERMELHRSEVVDGVARMRPVEGGIAIAPGEALDLKTGETHIMLIGLKAPLVAGASFKGTLLFEKAGAVPVVFKVEAFGAKAPAHTHHMP